MCVFDSFDKVNVVLSNLLIYIVCPRIVHSYLSELHWLGICFLFVYQLHLDGLHYSYKLALFFLLLTDNLSHLEETVFFF